jgi:serine/threonine protein kinase
VLLQASIPTEGGKGQPAPSRDEVAAAFPQLEILELIGQGGMGFVFKARQPKLERLVALKILPQALAADPAFAERFSREGRLLARLSHPNIVAIHDFGQAGGFFYLLMEFVDGLNLRQAMRAGRFTPAQALVVVPKIWHLCLDAKRSAPCQLDRLPGHRIVGSPCGSNANRRRHVHYGC